MDDTIFDQRSASEWIASVESEAANVRESDIYPQLRTWLDRHSPREILDIGCGQGACSQQVDLTKCSYTGVDPSAFLIARAEELFGDSVRRFIVGDAYALPFAGESFDAAFFVAVWHLLGDLPRAAAELSRVLRDNGTWFIVTANPHAYSLWTGRYAEGRVDGRRFEGINRLPDGSRTQDTLHLHTMDEIMGALQSNGLEVIASQEFRTSVKAPTQHLYLSIQGQKFP